MSNSKEIKNEDHGISNKKFFNNIQKEITNYQIKRDFVVNLNNITNNCHPNHCEMHDCCDEHPKIIKDNYNDNGNNDNDENDYNHKNNYNDENYENEGDNKNKQDKNNKISKQRLTSKKIYFNYPAIIEENKIRPIFDSICKKKAIDIVYFFYSNANDVTKILVIFGRCFDSRNIDIFTYNKIKPEIGSITNVENHLSTMFKKSKAKLFLQKYQECYDKYLEDNKGKPKQYSTKAIKNMQSKELQKPKILPIIHMGSLIYYEVNKKLRDKNMKEYQNLLKLFPIEQCDPENSICGGIKRKKGQSFHCPHYNLLALYPELCLEWNYIENGDIKPQNLYCQTAQKYFWLCTKQKCGHHIWEISSNSRIRAGSNCPYCNNSVICECNCLARTHPNVAELIISPIDTHKISYGSSLKVKFKCNKCPYDGCNHIWNAKICDSCTSEGCPMCRKGGIKNCIHTTMKYTHPHLEAEWDPDNALDGYFFDQITYSSNVIVKWICQNINKCPHGCHKWSTSPNKRTRTTVNKFMTSYGTGCPYCNGGGKICEHRNLETEFPDICLEWNYIFNDTDPCDYAPYSNKPVYWIHFTVDEIHIWEDLISNRTGVKTGCPQCSEAGCSKMQIAWLDSVARKENIHIIHKLNNDHKEYSIKGIGKVDGYCISNNTIYEFNGDYWHGNPGKFDMNDVNPSAKKLYALLYKNTIEREQLILSKKYNLVVKWESDLPPVDKLPTINQLNSTIQKYYSQNNSNKLQIKNTNTMKRVNNDNLNRKIDCNIEGMNDDYILDDDDILDENNILDDIDKNKKQKRQYFLMITKNSAIENGNVLYKNQ